MEGDSPLFIYFFNCAVNREDINPLIAACEEAGINMNLLTRDAIAKMDDPGNETLYTANLQMAAAIRKVMDIRKVSLPDFPTSAISYQPQLAEFIIEHRLQTIVETGLGISTIYILRAMDEMNAGNLTSIDPNPWFKSPIVHPRLTWLQDKSCNALPKIAGPWDLFLHDGSHNVYSQTLEYHYAWGMLRKGGWLVSDDWTWGSHDAWRNFLRAHKLKDSGMDSLRIVQKTTDASANFPACHAIALQAEREWLAAGNKNSDCFEDH